MASRKQKRKSARIAKERSSLPRLSQKRKDGDRARRFGPSAREAIQNKHWMQQHFVADPSLLGTAPNTHQSDEPDQVI